MHPSGKWLASIHATERIAFWPLNRRYPRIIRQPGGGDVSGVAFGPNGEWLYSTGTSPGVGLWRWALHGAAGSTGELMRAQGFRYINVDRAGRFLSLPGNGSRHV